MVMMALLPPGGLLGGYGADPDGVNGSWEEACTCVSTSIRVRVAVAAGEYPRHLVVAALPYIEVQISSASRSVGIIHTVIDCKIYVRIDCNATQT